MLKEIYEQPEAIRETIGDRVRGHDLVLEALGMTEVELQNLRRVVVVACGTAYHAAVVGRYVIEEWARVPVEPDIASEWIYRNPVSLEGHARDRDLAVGRDARHRQRDEARAERGARTLAITNLMGRRSRARRSRRSTRAAGSRSASPRPRRSPRRSRCSI
jgi:Glucosamine 6-phosphate synthetase, contains amidotransferase and phosphosugar isomerase domains